LPAAAWIAGAPTSVLVAASGIATLILFRHRANVRRIARGTERRFGEGR
jgi:glycerol-3-phosphate acyltransferase PlsY